MKERFSFVKDFLNHCKFEKNLSEKTVYAYKVDLFQFTQYLNEHEVPKSWENIDRSVLRDYIHTLYQRQKPKTIKRKVASLKVFFRFLEFEDLIVVSPFRKLDIRVKLEKHLPVVLTLTEIKSLFSYLDEKRDCFQEASVAKQRQLIRDSAILDLLFSTGIRVSELCHLRQENLDLESQTLRVLGKGKKERQIPLCGEGLTRKLRDYFQCFDMDLVQTPYVFSGRKGKPISDHTIRQLIQRICEGAGISKKVTPHTFRHTIATLLLESGVDIRFIQTFLGHSSINTTEIYVKVNDRAQRKILNEKHPRLTF